MRINGKLAGLLAVAGVAYVAGHFGVLTAVGPAVAQHEDIPPEWQAYMEAATPGKHHRYLDSLVGSWEGEFKITMEPGAEPFTSQGTIEREWVLGGRYLKETVTASSDMGSFNGLSYLGYNNTDGRYEMVWMEDMSTAMYFETGTLDPETKIMRTRGNHRDPRTGKIINTRGELDFSNPNRHVYISYATGPDGKEYPSFWGETVRK